MEIPSLADSEIRTAARQLLADCFGSVSPSLPVNLEHLIYDFLYPRDNLRFSDEDDLGVDNTGDEILGKMLAKKGRILVTSRLRRDGNEGRYRFTVAHELGHWLLHRPYMLAYMDAPSLFGSGTVDPELVSYRRTIFPSAGRQISRQEWQANRFAGALLADPALLREEIEKRFGPPPLCRSEAASDIKGDTLDGFARHLATTRRNGLKPLNEAFGLSGQAMSIALREHGFVIEFKNIL